MLQIHVRYSNVHSTNSNFDLLYNFSVISFQVGITLHSANNNLCPITIQVSIWNYILSQYEITSYLNMRLYLISIRDYFLSQYEISYLTMRLHHISLWDCILSQYEIISYLNMRLLISIWDYLHFQRDFIPIWDYLHSTKYNVGPTTMQVQIQFKSMVHFQRDFIPIWDYFTQYQLQCRSNYKVSPNTI